MSNRVEEIEALRKVFDCAKKSSRRKSGRLTDLDLDSKLYEALVTVGEKGFYELQDEIYPYLQDPLSELRAEAVRTLGWDTGLKINEFRKNDAYQIWLNDPDEEVKGAALAAWAGYYIGTQNPKVLKVLYDVIISEGYTPHIKRHALARILEVVDAKVDRREIFKVRILDESETKEEFDRGVDWDNIHYIMMKYVPGWKK